MRSAVIHAKKWPSDLYLQLTFLEDVPAPVRCRFHAGDMWEIEEIRPNFKDYRDENESQSMAAGEDLTYSIEIKRDHRNELLSSFEEAMKA